MTIAREGWPHIAVLVAVSLLLWALRFHWLGGVFFTLGLFTTFFFRDPERAIAEDPRLVVSPADGKVVRVVAASADNPLESPAQQISIFLSIFDVHINRAPVGGRIADVRYQAGEFLPAFNHNASTRNEQNTVVIEEGSTRIAFKQIAGLIARRIVFRKRINDHVGRGERVGMIQFGSRVDVFLPPSTRLRVQVGDRVKGGVSVIGELP